MSLQPLHQLLHFSVSLTLLARHEIVVAPHRHLQRERHLLARGTCIYCIAFFSWGVYNYNSQRKPIAPFRGIYFCKCPISVVRAHVDDCFAGANFAKKILYREIHEILTPMKKITMVLSHKKRYLS